MTHIAFRASNLKCLKLRGCWDMYIIFFTQTLKILQYLEELHLMNMPPNMRVVDVCAIVHNCPKLRSFSFGRGLEYLDDELQQYYYARGISESTPNLRHLRLVGLWILDEELEAILDGCPHLESLDLAQCCVLNLGDDLAKRCLEQIKDFRLPCLGQRYTTSFQ